MAEATGKWVTEEGLAVQQGAEIYAGMFTRPEDPWTDKERWDAVLKAPSYVLPERAVQGMNQAAIFLQIGLIQEGEVVIDGYVWQGIPEKPGYQLFHAKGRYAWYMVLADEIFDHAVAMGQVKHGV